MSHAIQQGVKQGVKQVTKTRWSRAMIADVGNWPIIGVNILGATMIVITSYRKLVYHPDISVSDELRSSVEVQNETHTRIEQAGLFRAQSKWFARQLYTPTMAIMKVATGHSMTDDEKVDKWNLTFLKNTNIDAPLEQTDFFDDGLFEGIEAKSWAKNEAV